MQFLGGWRVRPLLSFQSYRTAYDYAVVKGYTAIVRALMEDTDTAIQMLEENRKIHYGVKKKYPQIRELSNRLLFALCYQ